MGMPKGSKLSAAHRNSIAKGMRGNQNAKGNRTKRGPMSASHRSEIGRGMKRFFAKRKKVRLA